MKKKKKKILLKDKECPTIDKNIKTNKKSKIQWGNICKVFIHVCLWLNTEIKITYWHVNINNVNKRVAAEEKCIF